MFKQAEENLKNSIVETDNFDEMVNQINAGKVALTYHCGNSNCETEIKNKTTIKTRVIVAEDNKHRCIYCGKPSKYKLYFGKQY